MRGPGESMTVLGTAFSDPANHGTGHDEPMLMALTTEGPHLPPPPGTRSEAMSCVGFIVTLQRGAEWAATGKVTQKVPRDFRPPIMFCARNTWLAGQNLFCGGHQPDQPAIGLAGLGHPRLKLDSASSARVCRAQCRVRRAAIDAVERQPGIRDCRPGRAGLPNRHAPRRHWHLERNR